MRLSNRGLLLMLLAGALVWAAPARAEDPAPEAEAKPRYTVHVRVTHVMPEEGPIEAEDVIRELRGHLKDIRSQRILDSRRLHLEMNQQGKVQLPTGRWILVRPVKEEHNALLTNVEVEGTLKSDLRLRKGKKVIIGPQPYKGGKLVIVLESEGY